MGFMIVRRELGSYGEQVGQARAVAINLATKHDAEAEAERLASAHETNGFEREQGYWWYREDGRVFRLFVEQ